jgi:hypothetical protein
LNNGNRPPKPPAIERNFNTCPQFWRQYKRSPYALASRPRGDDASVAQSRMELPMRQDEQQRWISDDGQWVWDGTAWLPTSVPPDQPPTPAEPVAAPPQVAAEVPTIQPDATHPLSPDGTQIWDGNGWISYESVPNEPIETKPIPAAAEPTQAEQAPETPAEPTPVAPAPAPTNTPPIVATESAPPSPPDEHPISADGHWRWDGQAWQPVASSSPAESGTRQLSADGRWVWDGQAWQPTDSAAAKSPATSNVDPGVTALIASGMPVSDDGQWVWNGQAWQPANK